MNSRFRCVVVGIVIQQLVSTHSALAAQIARAGSSQTPTMAVVSSPAPA
ncbi:MAG: hypothetical protein NTW03_04590 [Verrucomicrobia bacterium]|nr:hypothetical protein [Verrucomicrobiota bacterium]